jgi:protein gp37
MQPGSHYTGTTKKVNGKSVWTGKIAKASQKTLTMPLRWKKRRMVFVNSMGDLFAPGVSDEMRDGVLATVALNPNHIFIWLTKRADLQRAYFEGLRGEDRIYRFDAQISGNLALMRRAWQEMDAAFWPTPRNLWLGVSAENQAMADKRIPDLLDTPAAIRFVSGEPMIGPVVIDPRLDWVIVGGESGAGYRKFDPNWARELRDQCAGADVPFFMKQMNGANEPIPKDLQVRQWPKIKGGRI